MDIKDRFSGEKLKNVPKMLIAVIFMGICVALLQMTSFGPDPCSTMNYGIAGLIGIPFGVYQMSINIIVFIIVFFIDRSLLGLGSFGNMILVGYAADLTTWLVEKIFDVQKLTEIGPRLAVMVPALIVFIIAAAVYMNCGLGTAPYDATSFLLHKRLFADRGKKIPFRLSRIVYDAIAALIGFLTGGGVGLVTILMVPALGPAVDFVGKLMKKRTGDGRNNG